MNLIRSNLMYLGGYLHRDTRATACAGSISINVSSAVYSIYWGNFMSMALQVRAPWGEAPFSYTSFRGLGAPHAWREEYDIPVV